MQINAAVSCKF